MRTRDRRQELRAVADPARLDELAFGPCRRRLEPDEAYLNDSRRLRRATLRSVVRSRVLDGLGLMGDGGHTVDEVADLKTLVSQSQRAALLLYRLSKTSH